MAYRQVAYKDEVQDGDLLNVGADSELTISSGVVTATKTYHTIDTESDASSDDLDQIDGGADGDILVIRPNNDGRTVVVKHNASSTSGGDILLNGDTDYTMDDEDDLLTLIYDAGLDSANGAWVEISRGQGNVATLTSNAPADVGTVASAGSGSAAAKDDHVHDTGAGFIDNANKFTAGVVDAAAIGSNAVAASEIDETATDIAFAQIILTPNATPTGTAEGTTYYDSDDDHLYVNDGS